MKKYLMMGAAALTIMMTASCSKDKDLYTGPANGQTTAESKFVEAFSKNFPEWSQDQDWKMIETRQANIKVDLDLDQSYTVAIYTDNPLFNSEASLLAMKAVTKGGTATMNFEAPAAQSTFFVGVFDTKGRGITEAVSMTEGKLNATIGGQTTAKARAFRATEAGSSYAKTINDYLSWSVSDMESWTALTNEVLTSYPNGNHTLNDLQYMEGSEEGKYYGDGDGAHYRIPAGVTVDESWNIGNGATLDNVVIYVEGKTVITPSNNLNAVTLVVANGGEVELQGTNNMSTTGRFIVFAGGKITGEDGATLSINNAGACYNAGTIDFVGTLRVNGSDFYNCGTIDVDILTGTSGGTTVTNFGSITARTNTIQGEAYNGKYINGCHLTFTENAGIGQLTLLDNSRLDAGGQLYLTGNINMENLSEIKAGSIYWQDGRVEGPTGSEWCVIKADKFLVSHADEIWTNGNVYYDLDPKEFYNYQDVKYTPTDITTQAAWDAAHHIKGGTDGNSCWCDHPITLWINEETAPAGMVIPAGDCTGTGFNDKDPIVIPIPDAPVYYSVAFEDLGSFRDFDFNDVVLYVAHNEKTNKATVNLVATCGTLSVIVKYDGTELMRKTDGKINQGSRDAVISSTEIDMTSSADLEKFTLEVIDGEGNSQFIQSANAKGKAPMALVIPGKWAWPKEGVNIVDAYPGLINEQGTVSDATKGFAAWVKGTNDNGWYNYPNRDKVIQ